MAWRSSEAAMGLVEYGLGQELGMESGPTPPGTIEHRVELFGLKTGRDYFYRVVARCEGGGLALGDLETFRVEVPPRELGLPFLSRADPDEAEPNGYVLLSEYGPGGSWVVAVDRDGDVVWYRHAGSEVLVLSSRSSRDGSGVIWFQQDLEQAVDIAATVHVPFLGEDSETTVAKMGHHDFAELPDGRLGFLSLELGWYEINGEMEYIAGDAILEIDSGSTDREATERVFSFFEDYGHPPWPASPEFSRTIAEGYDWTHANSLAYDEASDDYFVGARNLDAILRVDRGTGEVLWQMGGEYGDFSFAPHATRWSHGHFSEIWEGGLLLFDNRAHGSPEVSRVVEYAWNERTRTVDQVWEYVDERGRLAAVGGDARRLPSGNVLVSWGSMGMVNEIARDGTVVWQVEFPVGVGTGRVSWIGNLEALR